VDAFTAYKFILLFKLLNQTEPLLQLAIVMLWFTVSYYFWSIYHNVTEIHLFMHGSNSS